MVDFLEGFSQRENNLLRVDNLIFTSYEAITVLLYQNYSKMFIT
jgi:hypothetical protein